MGVCETIQEPDSCPPYYTPPRPSPDDNGGDAPGLGDGFDPNSNGGDSGSDGGSSGRWPPKLGPWPNRPSGLWKLKKTKRGCDAAAAPFSLKSASLSSSVNNNHNSDYDEHVVAVVAEPEKPPTRTIQKGYNSKGEIDLDYAFAAPSRAVQDSFRDVDSVALVSAGEDPTDIPLVDEQEVGSEVSFIPIYSNLNAKITVLQRVLY